MPLPESFPIALANGLYLIATTLGFGAKNKISNLARRKLKIILTVVVFEIDFWQLDVYEAFSSF